MLSTVDFFASKSGFVIGKVFYIVISQRDRRIYPFFAITNPLLARLKCSERNRRPSRLEFLSDVYASVICQVY